MSLILYECVSKSLVQERAVSKSQQRLFGMVRATQTGKMKDPPKKIKKLAKDVSKSEVLKIASTSTKGLPEKK